MRSLVVILVAGFGFSATSAFAGGGADAGMLTCKLKGVQNDIVYTKEEFACEFKLSNGELQTYTGQITSIGVDLSVTKDLTLVWAVLNPAGSVAAPNELRGDYVGGGATVALGAGGGLNVLVGGGANSFTLQPLSASGFLGGGVNVGIEKFALR